MLFSSTVCVTIISLQFKPNSTGRSGDVLADIWTLSSIKTYKWLCSIHIRTLVWLNGFQKFLCNTRGYNQHWWGQHRPGMLPSNRSHIAQMCLPQEAGISKSQPFLLLILCLTAISDQSRYPDKQGAITVRTLMLLMRKIHSVLTHEISMLVCGSWHW